MCCGTTTNMPSPSASESSPHAPDELQRFVESVAHELAALVHVHLHLAYPVRRADPAVLGHDEQAVRGIGQLVFVHVSPHDEGVMRLVDQSASAANRLTARDLRFVD